MMYAYLLHARLRVFMGQPETMVAVTGTNGKTLSAVFVLWDRVGKTGGEHRHNWGRRRLYYALAAHNTRYLTLHRVLAEAKSQASPMPGWEHPRTD